ncbi:MAG: protein-methionine-sulfoxide reductase catalytic subunit MsrP [Burkholderiales bacterium]|jgi:sulfoxide reductase catalytic subunit YedY|nr:protein-methionine-sulfoxide reductase catalytic subunit MsrP [Burkholderiales bacterium]
MLIKRASDVLPSEITPEGVYVRRRTLMKAAAAGSILAATGSLAPESARAQGGGLAKIPGYKKSAYSTAEQSNTYKQITTYNNFYEFGTDKDEPARYADKLKVKPWTVVVEGEVKKPRTFGIEELMKLPMEERIYRLRCVEAWSMVIPWVGFEFRELAKLVEPTGNAKFVEFVTAYQPEVMPGVRLPVLDWPYVEGLRMDEAMHPLTIMAVGLYGEILPNQNGAPVRLVVPWKYGFKSGKSIVRIRFVEKQPKTAWEKAAPHEYGFYSNVNPDVDHPRWSQKREKRLPSFFATRDTVIFNGYGEQVASLYAGMDLKKSF